MMESTQRRAILSGDNTQAPVLDLDLVGGTAAPGDRVLSTGDGGLLPAGVPVGVVVKDGRALRVALFAASAGDYVRVLDYHLPPPPAASGATPASLGLRPTASDRAKSSVTVSTTLVQKAPAAAPVPRATPAATVATASVQKAPPPAPRAAPPTVEAPVEPVVSEPPPTLAPSEEPPAIVVQEGDYVPPSDGGEVR
jgi:rod shape-determining protein MreC